MVDLDRWIFQSHQKHISLIIIVSNINIFMVYINNVIPSQYNVKLNIYTVYRYNRTFIFSENLAFFYFLGTNPLVHAGSDCWQLRKLA